MKIKNNFELEEQDILTGSRILKSSKTKNRIDYFYEHADDNFLIKNNILNKEDFFNKFKNYRRALKVLKLKFLKVIFHLSFLRFFFLIV